MDKIVLCVGDSLGMPRQGVSFLDTWFYRLLKVKSNYYFLNNFRRALTTNELESRDLLENYCPNIVILQVGIVDCAPRYFKRNSLFIKIINRSPSPLRNLFWKAVKRLMRRKLSKCDVPPDTFKDNLLKYLKRCENCGVEKLIVLKIPTPSKPMIDSNPQIINSIRVYNEILQSMNYSRELILIDLLENSNENDFIEDGYHLSKQGFERVFDSLVTVF